MSENNESGWGNLFWIGIGILFIIRFVGDGCSNINSDTIFNSKKECSYCSGTGEDDCSLCYGDGVTKCSWCYGEGKKRCLDCSGNGKKSAYFPQQMQNGYQYATYQGQTEYVWVWGNHYADFPCKKCSKTGKVECDNISCEDGKVECVYCYGKGKKQCSYCNGEGSR